MFVEVLALFQIQILDSYLIYINSQWYLERGLQNYFTQNKSEDWIFLLKDVLTYMLDCWLDPNWEFDLQIFFCFVSEEIILFFQKTKNKEGGSRKGNLLVEIFVVGSGSFQFSLWWLFEDYAVSPRVCPLICFRVSSFFCFFSCCFYQVFYIVWAQWASTLPGPSFTLQNVRELWK